MAKPKTYHTRAQDELLKFLKSTPGEHHTAMEIETHFADCGNPIGTATIYRHLDRFVEDGCVQKYILGPGESACYAYVVSSNDRASHFHCKCEQCGRLIHLDCDELREIEAHLLDHHGFAWNTGRTVFYGTCELCQRA